MTTPDTSLLEFPCDFPIKVMGLAGADFDLLVVDLVLKHVTALREGAIQTRASKQGTYTSLTITVEATSQAQLDAVYRELSGHARVLMVL